MTITIPGTSVRYAIDTASTGPVSSEAKTLAASTIATASAKSRILTTIFGTQKTDLTPLGSAARRRAEQLLGPLKPMNASERSAFNKDLEQFARDHIEQIKGAHKVDTQK